MTSVVRIRHGLSRHGCGQVLEASLELTLARLITLLPAHRFLPPPEPASAPSPADPEQIATARRVGAAVASVARWLPFRALCLQQAIAARRILRRRGCSTTLCLGVNTAPEARRTPRDGRAAHAWLCVGEEVVCGDGRLDNYAVVARFD